MIRPKREADCKLGMEADSSIWILTAPKIASRQTGLVSYFLPKFVLAG